MLRTKKILPLAATALALSAAPALADDRYVSPTGYDEEACNLAHPCASVQRGVNATQPGDTLHIAPGLYVESVTITKEIKVVGSGGGDLDGADPATDTIVRGVSVNGAGYAITATAGAEIRDLRAVGADTSTTGGMGLDLRGGGPTVRRYVIRGVTALGGAGGEGGHALSAFSIDSQGTMELDIRSSRFGHVDTGFSQAALTFRRGSSIRLEDVAVRSRGFGLRLEDGAEMEADRLDLHAPNHGGIDMYGGSRLKLSRSTVRSGMWALYLAGYDGSSRNARAEIHDSVIAAEGPWANLTAVTVRFGNGPGPWADGTVLVMRGSTVVARGPDAGAALELYAQGAGTGVSADVANTILRATDTAGPADDADVRVPTGDGAESLIASHSSFTDVVNLGGGLVPAPGAGTNVAGDPGLADDLSLAPSSPLVDAGGAVWATSETDAAGAPRVADGDGDCTAAPDVGAYERAATGCPGEAQAPAEQAPGGGAEAPTRSEGTQPAGDASPPAADRTAPRIIGLKLARRTVRIRRGAVTLPAVQFAVSEPATVTAVVQRARRGGGWRRLRTLRVRPGAALPRLKGAIAGRHRYRLIATDAAGNRSAPLTIGFRVRA